MRCAVGWGKRTELLYTGRTVRIPRSGPARNPRRRPRYTRSSPPTIHLSAMHLHTVYFWLHDGLSAADVRPFEDALTGLLAIPSVRAGRVGVPISSPRDVVDDSFDFSLHLVFDSTADHDAYQTDPVHVAFVYDHASKWTRVVVYDSEVRASEPAELLDPGV